MRKWVYIVLVALVCSCKSPEVVTVKETQTETITETVHDTVFEIQADSSYYQAYIKCINDKPVLTQTTSRPGKKLASPKVDLKDSALTVDCEAEAQKLFASWKAKHKTTAIIKEVPVEVPRKPTFWQNTLQTMGVLFLIIIVTATIQLIFKRFIKP